MISNAPDDSDTMSTWNYFEKRLGVSVYISTQRQRKAGRQKRRMSANTLLVGFAWFGAMPAFSVSRSTGIQFHTREDRQSYSVADIYTLELRPAKHKRKFKRPARWRFTDNPEQMQQLQG